MVTNTNIIDSIKCVVINSLPPPPLSISLPSIYLYPTIINPVIYDILNDSIIIHLCINICYLWNFMNLPINIPISTSNPNNNITIHLCPFLRYEYTLIYYYLVNVKLPLLY